MKKIKYKQVKHKRIGKKIIKKLCKSPVASLSAQKYFPVCNAHLFAIFGKFCLQVFIAQSTLKSVKKILVSNLANCFDMVSQILIYTQPVMVYIMPFKHQYQHWLKCTMIQDLLHYNICTISNSLGVILSTLYILINFA